MCLYERFVFVVKILIMVQFFSNGMINTNHSSVSASFSVWNAISFPSVFFMSIFFPSIRISLISDSNTDSFAVDSSATLYLPSLHSYLSLLLLYQSTSSSVKRTCLRFCWRTFFHCGRILNANEEKFDPWMIHKNAAKERHWESEKNRNICTICCNIWVYGMVVWLPGKVKEMTIFEGAAEGSRCGGCLWLRVCRRSALLPRFLIGFERRNVVQEFGHRLQMRDVSHQLENWRQPGLLRTHRVRDSSMRLFYLIA